jgi:hypothetical protein
MRKSVHWLLWGKGGVPGVLDDGRCLDEGRSEVESARRKH